MKRNIEVTNVDKVYDEIFLKNCIFSKRKLILTD